MMMDTLDENVMKDILSMGLEKEQKGKEKKEKRNEINHR